MAFLSGPQTAGGAPQRVSAGTPTAVHRDSIISISEISKAPGSAPSAALEEDDVFQSHGMRITFQHLIYQVRNRANKTEKISILKDVSGFLNPSQMTAVMGPSGCGKTTLLDNLAGRKTTGALQGRILFAGQQPTQTFLRRYTGYVEQFDTLLPMLTVYQMLLYTSELKNPISVCRKDKVRRVEELLEKLALSSARNTVIGDAMQRGVSGGEAKRTNVGIALITNPRVLFLDEPTSGLDSYTAGEVMEVVKLLVKEGITICTTIHSPSPHTFALFDRVIIMQRGRIVYFGGNGQAVSAYFTSALPEVRGMTTDQSNIAEWVVDLTTKADRTGQAGYFADSYAASALCRENQEQLEKYVRNEHTTISQKTLQQLQVKRATATPTWWAFLMMWRYRTKANFLSWTYMGPRFGDKVIYAFLIFTVYWGLGDNFAADNVINIAGVLFLWITLPAYGAAAFVPAIVLERPVFVREQSDGLYRVITYLTFKIAEELVLAAFISLASTLLVYFTVQLQGSFMIVFLIYLITLSNGIVLAYAIGAISPTMDFANAALPAYVTALLFFAGFLVRWDNIPSYWIWFAYLNFMWYGWAALMINEFAGRNVQIFGQEVLAYFSLDGISSWAYTGYCSLFFVAFFLLAWLALAFKKHQNR
ncbi:hypothetical protein WJX72_004137 [[Myrmecia] bisecta]|uniref:ABC transporter domain-containing protein n=1 Tax=[Myrmecia] bisecta TaxID=41462 RepID=A0AAW1P906_9CHLO